MPTPWTILTFISLIMEALAGAAIGVVIGGLTSFGARAKRKRPLADGLIGAGGFLAGSIGASEMPWHRNTILYHPSGGILVTSTADFYQHAEWVGAAVAIILSCWYEVLRLRQGRQS